jgi:hypothetical protein
MRFFAQSCEFGIALLLPVEGSISLSTQIKTQKLHTLWTN